MWLRSERPERARKLSLDQIVRATVDLLDREGLDAVSMRRIAGELGVTPGSLYWYVETKDDLLELALDAVLGELDVDPAVGPEGWRPTLREIAQSTRAMMLNHPWMIPLRSTQPNMGPNGLRAAERMLSILDDAGFEPAAQGAVMAALDQQVIGAVVAETAWLSLVRSAGSLADWREHAAVYMQQIERDHPRLAARFMADPDIQLTSADRFSFALDCLLDGIEQRHRPKRRRGQGR